MLEISLDTVLFRWVLKVWLDDDDDDDEADGENETGLGDNWISDDDDRFEFLLFFFDSAEEEEEEEGEDEEGGDWLVSSFTDKTFTSCASGSFLLRNWSMPLTKFVIDFLVVADSLELFFSFRASFSWVFLRRKNL